MKIKFKGNNIEDDVSMPGLFDCTLTHEIKATKGSITWNGPKIPPEVWNQVLSFFKWTYDATHSESQVRLYVSPTQQTWKAWAFPQEAKSGMTATELSNEEAKKQRETLGLNPPDWYLFGTVHHHCSMTAFQSGTDLANEENQDGLHITIGNMNKELYDIHARFYRKGLKFDPDMSWFFDVSEVQKLCPKALRVLMPKDWSDKTARSMMCQPPEKVEFPEQWMNNLIEIKPEPPPSGVVTMGSGSFYGGHHSGGNHSSNVPPHFSAEHDPLWKRSKNAWEQIIYQAVKNEIPVEDLESALGDLGLEGFAYNVILTACIRHKVDMLDIEREKPLRIDELMVQEGIQQAREREQSAAKEEKETSPQPTQSGLTPQEEKEIEEYLRGRD